MTDNNHPALSQRNTTAFRGIVGHAQLPSAATDLILLGDLTGRYATGSYSRLASDGRTVIPRGDRQGAAEHGHRITAAIACHVARAGGSIDQLTQLLLHPEHEGGRHTRTIALRSGQTRALDYIRRVWASASDAISSTRALGSRHEAYEVLAALRDRIETTPWRGERGRTALRVLRAHLNFAEIAGGPLHHASERQTAEEAGVSRTTLRVVYETVLRPRGWLRRLRVGHGREGSTWYLGDGGGKIPGHGDPALLSRFRSTQFPPDPALGEWTTPETATTADIDSTVLGRLMGHDAFAHHALGSAALLLISALHLRPDQTVAELVGTSSVSRATTYRTLKRLADHGLVQHTRETWSLTPRALEGFGIRLPDADNGHTPAQGWTKVAEQHGTWGIAARRKVLHAAERAAYQEALDRLAGHRSRALVIVRDDRQVLVPVPRPDEIPPTWHAPDGRVLDPVTGRPAADWRVATDGRLILITPADQRSYDELAAAHAEALSEWESVA
ncbi:transcriptional regulator [Streptomyces mirabilis]|uniref:transcriptional regulator n=1 Tax=Streptomyces mirabilis TaxID=68239 RepID=UPI0036A93271